MPFLLIVSLGVGGLLRSAFGRVGGSLVKGMAVTGIDWLIVGSLLIAVFAGITAMFITLIRAAQSTRERAIKVFSHLRVSDTEQNNGVLIYVLLADRALEIVTDRSIHVKVGDECWLTICKKHARSLFQI